MFEINGYTWRLVFVNSNSEKLMRSDCSITVGMTDWNDKCVYLSNKLRGSFLRRVIAHELAHCICFSYDLYMPLKEEENLANWVSLYGSELVYLLDDLMRMVLQKAN